MPDFIYHKRYSSGKPMVFLIHGFLENSSMWSSVTATDDFDYIEVDLPGHGISELGQCPMPPTMAYFTDRVLELVDYYDIKSYHVIGHSMGGYVGLDLKSKDSRCQKVILLNSNFWEDSPEKKSDRLRVADLVTQAKDLFIQTAIPGLFQTPNTYQDAIQELISSAKHMLPDGIAYATLAMRNRQNHSSLINTFPYQITMLCGDNDPLMSLAFLEQQCSGLPITLIPIEHSGHMSHIENSGRTCDLLLEILKTK